MVEKATKDATEKASKKLWEVVEEKGLIKLSKYCKKDLQKGLTKFNRDFQKQH